MSAQVQAVPMTTAQAYQRARAIWPDRLVVAAQFGDMHKIEWYWGVQSRTFYGASFEECFAKAVTA